VTASREREGGETAGCIYSFRNLSLPYNLKGQIKVPVGCNLCRRANKIIEIIQKIRVERRERKRREKVP
jgi:hypothetical protein